MEPSFLKAQLYQESTLDTDAKSPVGAFGIAQFMPSTWKQISDEMGIPDRVSAGDAYYSILASAYYMKKLWRSWSSPRPDIDRYYLALASYNAGFGNILKAQKNSKMKKLYSEIMPYLPEVTGRHSEETITYVERIKRLEIEFRRDFKKYKETES